MNASAIILASRSRYRADLLCRLGLAFSVEAADIDESPRDREPPAELALRLARDKAAAVAARHPGSMVIGSDQVAEIDGELLGKPGNAAAAEQQLMRSSGSEVRFHTAACLHQQGDEICHVDCTRVLFRNLTAAEVHRYIAAEKPLDCAGSFKCEGLGISLFERIDSSDPTALIGLPLIALCRMLREAGHALP